MAYIPTMNVPATVLALLQSWSVQEAFTQEQASEAISILLKIEAMKEMSVGQVEALRRKAYAGLLMLGGLEGDVSNN